MPGKYFDVFTWIYTEKGGKKQYNFFHLNFQWKKADEKLRKMCENMDCSLPISYHYLLQIIHTFYSFFPSENGDEKGFEFFTIIFSLWIIAVNFSRKS
jgi:hypothetical protein